MQKKVVVISGYFNPCHMGHIEYARAARDVAGPEGIVYCIINSDAQSHLKKGYSFIPEKDRLAVMNAMRYIDHAILSVDTDRTVCKTLELLCTSAEYETPTHFLNDGDVTAQNRCPEEVVCETHGIALVYASNGKIQSSSWILEKSVREAYHQMSKIYMNL